MSARIVPVIDCLALQWQFWIFLLVSSNDFWAYPTLLYFATCLSCIFSFSPLTAKQIKVKNTVLHTDLCNMKIQMFLRMCWALEHLSGLMNLGCGLWGDTFIKSAQQRSVASMCCFHILHISAKKILLCLLKIKF